MEEPDTAEPTRRGKLRETEEGRNVTEEIRDEREASDDHSSELSCCGDVTIQLMFQGRISVSLDDLPGVREGRGGW